MTSPMDAATAQLAAAEPPTSGIDHSQPAKLSALLRMGRPHFLLAGVAFVALGAALAHGAGTRLDAATVALAQLVVTCTQWAVQYHNEAHDADADAANAQRSWLSGGSGIIAGGQATVAQALGVARLLYAAAIVAAAGLAALAPATAPVAAALIVLAWAYSAPPARLCARGWGEAAAGIVVGGLTPGLVLAGHGVGIEAWRAWLALLPLVLLVAAAVLALSVPDMPGDAQAGKRTLAVRLGPARTRLALRVFWLLPGFGSMAAVLAGAPMPFAAAGSAALMAALALPVFWLRQAWTNLALMAIGLAALQWGLTMAWALG